MVTVKYIPVRKTTRKKIGKIHDFLNNLVHFIDIFKIGLIPSIPLIIQSFKSHVEPLLSLLTTVDTYLVID